MEKQSAQLNGFVKMNIFMMFFFFGLSFLFAAWENRLPTDCYQDFRNDSLMETMYTFDGGDDYVPIQCKDMRGDDYGKCIYSENVTKHQRDFSNTCRWLGPSYFAGGGKFAFRMSTVFFIVLTVLAYIKPKWILKHFISRPGNVY